MPLLSVKKAPLYLAFALVACGDPELPSDLNTAGPPEVTEVHATLDSGAAAAVFCTNDTDLKVSTAYCPVDDASASEVAPANPRIRIVFDELLDPSIETLEDPGDGSPNQGTLRDTDPVAIECNGTALAYDGFYDPSGNHITNPPGPALVVDVADFGGTAVDCTLTLKDVIKDKGGNAVPDMQREYSFTMAPLRLAGTQPAPYDTEAMPEPPVIDPSMEGMELVVAFNAPVDPASLAGQITLADAAGTDVPVTLMAAGNQVLVVPDTALTPGTEYNMTIVGPGSTVADAVAGNALSLGADVLVKFVVASSADAMPPDAPPADEDGGVDAGADAGTDAGDGGSGMLQ